MAKNQLKRCHIAKISILLQEIDGAENDGDKYQQISDWKYKLK